MASITLNIPDHLVDEVAESLNYTGIDAAGKPVGKVAHIKQAIIGGMRDSIVRRRVMAAQQALVAQAASTVTID